MKASNIDLMIVLWACQIPLFILFALDKGAAEWLRQFFIMHMR